MKLIKNMLITSVGLVLACGSVFAKSNSAKMEVTFQVVEACLVKPEVKVERGLNNVKNVSVNVVGSCSNNSSFLVTSEKLNENSNQIHLSSVNKQTIAVQNNDAVLVNIMY